MEFSKKELHQIFFFSVLLALQLASDKLKQCYLEKMIDWVIDQPFNLNSSGGTNSMSREQGYVDLAVLTGEQVDNEWKNSDREAIMEMKHLQIESIGIEDLWKPTDQFVVVRGVAGIGKSTLIQRYVLKWAKDEILNGKNNENKIDFLFFFECRELNTITNISSFEELLKVKYPKLFDFIGFTDLQNITDRIMIIVDGLDELQGIYSETQKETFPMREMVKRMIDPKSDVLKGHKTIVGGRHNACESIKSKMKETLIKIVEVCGFSENKSIEFIDRFFQSDVQRANKVKEMIKRPNLRVMSNVPILLWTICLLYSEDFEEEINSVTELYFYGLLAFLKNHTHNPESAGNIGLSSFVTSQHIGKIVYSLSTLSVKTYMDGKVIFTDDDIKDIECDLHLEATGLLVKHSVGNFGHQAHQFKHLVFQEFLCALHLCLAKGISKYKTNRELSSCTSTILGIHHLVETESNQLFLEFYRNMEVVHKNSRTWIEYFMAFYEYFKYSNFIKQCKQMIQQNQQMIQGNCKKGEFLIYDIDFKLFEFIRNFRENRWLIDDKIVEKIRNCKIKVIMAVNGSTEALAFLRSLKIDRIYDLQLFAREFTEGELDLVRMTEKNPLLTIGFDSGLFSTYKSNIYLSKLEVSMGKKQIIPNGIKSLFNEFLINTYSTNYRRNISKYPPDDDDDDDDDDYMFYILSDLIEHVLENNGDKNLKLEKPSESPSGSNGLIHKILVQRIQRVFGQREHFGNITIEQ